MPEIAVAIPGDPATATGGYVYARRLMAALPATGWQPRLLRLPASFPFPDRCALDETAAAFATLTPHTPVLVDGLAFGAMPRALLTAQPLSFAALIHHPLAAETGLSAEAAASLHASECDALACAAQVITTSAHTARRLTADYGVAPTKITVARPGTDRATRTDGSPDAPLLLTVATLTQRKGHLALVAALATLRALPWRAVFVGSETRDPATANVVRAAVVAQQLEDRIAFRGEVDEPTLDALYRSADVFVLPSTYEGYGMAFAEALAHGLPVIGCDAGAVSETVPADAGLLVPPDAPSELAAALRCAIGDPVLRKKMGDAAWRSAEALPHWSDTARAVAQALDKLSQR